GWAVPPFHSGLHGGVAIEMPTWRLSLRQRERSSLAPPCGAATVAAPSCDCDEVPPAPAADWSPVGAAAVPPPLDSLVPAAAGAAAAPPPEEPLPDAGAPALEAPLAVVAVAAAAVVAVVCWVGGCGPAACAAARVVAVP